MLGPIALRLSEMERAARQANAALVNRQSPRLHELFARRYHEVAQEILDETGLDPRWECPDSLKGLIDPLPANLVASEPMLHWAWIQGETDV